MAYFDNMKLDKDMYKIARKSFTNILEELDPTAHYENSELSRLDAYQRQLKRFDIKVTGAGSDVIEKFFQTSDSAVLFPEYVSRAIRQGMEEQNILPEMIATTTRIDSMDYRTMVMATSEEDREPKRIGEGAMIPQTELKIQSNLVKLHKRGRMLVASYESVRFQRLDLFTVALKQIGNAIMASHVKDAVDVLISGDGNQNPITEVDAETENTLAYDDLVNLWSKFDPYEMNTMLVPNAVMLQLLKLEEFKNPETGLNFQATGKLSTPLGAKLIRSSAVPAGKVIGLDQRFALEMVKSSDITIDYDKLIDRQLERAAITSIAGFAKLFNDASYMLNINI